MAGLTEKTSRRAVLGSLGAFGLALGIGRRSAAAGISTSASPATRPIPTSGEALPVIGMGSWITFDVGRDRSARDRRIEVLRAFFEAGGAMIDSSPMYGSSEEVIGHALGRLEDKASLFSATKVWTPSARRGPEQMEASRRLWGVERFDLLQVHNLVEWEGHLETLEA